MSKTIHSVAANIYSFENVFSNLDKRNVNMFDIRIKNQKVLCRITQQTKRRQLFAKWVSYGLPQLVNVPNHI